MKLSSKTEISRGEYQQLLGIALLAQKYNDALADLQEVALEITGELDRAGVPEKKHGGGHVCDWIYGSRSTDELLDLLSLKVASDQNS
jgi:hypothetical protein